MDSAALEQIIVALETLDLEGLRAFWSRQFGPPPMLRSVELLRLLLAYRLQARVLGDLDSDTRRKLRRKGSVDAEGLHLGEGAVLRRVWQGETIEAVVVAEGFRFRGARYRSLSAVAEAATGTRWNGPRFFGLRAR